MARGRGALLAWLAVGLAGLVGLAGAAPAAAQEGEYRTLFDGESLDGWVIENTGVGNIHVRDGVIVVQGPGGWLRSAERYRNFRLELEFRIASDGADSGVFVRAATTGGFSVGWPNRSYQVQIRDMHQPSRFIGLGDVFRHGMPPGDADYAVERVEALYAGVGVWHELAIEVVGDFMTVYFEGEPVLWAYGIGNDDGYIGFQAEAGVVEYRNVRIIELTS